MSATHTQGRITVRENGEANSYAILDDKGQWLLSLLHNGQQLTDTQRENLRRLVACWNACENLPTDFLAVMSTFAGNRMLPTYALAIDQRDELLAALKLARKSLQVANDTPDGPIRDTIWHGPAETLFDFMDAAIEKAQGGAT